MRALQSVETIDYLFILSFIGLLQNYGFRNNNTYYTKNDKSKPRIVKWSRDTRKRNHLQNTNDAFLMYECQITHKQ